MDPEKLKQLLDSGSISQGTYDAAVNAPIGKVSAAPMGAMGSNADNSPPVQAPSYEGATLQSMGGNQPPPPSSDAPMQRPSYEGASLSNMPTPAAAPPAPPGQAPAAPPPASPPAQSAVPSAPGVSPNYVEMKPDEDPNPAPAAPAKAATLPAQSVKPASASKPGAAPMTSSQMQTAELEKGAKKEEDYGKREIANATALADAKQQGLAEATNLINNQINNETEANKRRDADFAAAQQLALDTQDQLQKKWQAYGDTKIDPDRKWKSLSAGGKIGVAAGLFIGGLAGGMGDGRFTKGNGVFDMWQNKINQDIAAQVDDLQTKRDAINGETNIAAKKYALAQDWRGVQIAKNAEGWQQLGYKLQSLANQTTSAEVRAKLEQQKIDVDRRTDGAYRQLAAYQIQLKAGQEQAAARAAAQQAAAVADRRKKYLEDIKWLMKERKMPRDKAINMSSFWNFGTTVDGEDPGTIPSEADIKAEAESLKPTKATKEEKEKAQMTTSLGAGLKRLDEIEKDPAIKNYGFYDVAKSATGATTPDQARVDQINHEFFSMAAPLVHDATGRINETEIHELEKAYNWKAGESAEVRRQKTEGFKTWLRRRAADNGIDLGNPPPTTGVGDVNFKK